MIGLILVTHGRLADQFVEAMEHVVGKQTGIATVCIGPNDDMEQRRAEIADKMQKSIKTPCMFQSNFLLCKLMILIRHYTLLNIDLISIISINNLP